ncbi:MAG: hypothetical protein QUV07_13290 [Cyanobium sp. CZS 25K]|nr:hypothetical protein [Cyanobium sp. CZS25K]
MFSSLPVRLLDPAWQLQLAAAFTSAGFFLLIGTLLVCTADAFPVASETLNKQVKVLRKLCTWLAILYLVLIPVQLYAGVRVLQQKSSEDGRPLAQWQKLKRQIEATTNEQELRTLLGNLKQPITLPVKLDAPFATVRQAIVDQADSRFNALAYEVEQARSKRVQGFIGEATNNCLRSLLFAAGFAAFARPKPGALSLLEHVLELFGLYSPRRRSS